MSDVITGKKFPKCAPCGHSHPRRAQTWDFDGLVGVEHLVGGEVVGVGLELPRRLQLPPATRLVHVVVQVPHRLVEFLRNEDS